MNLIKIIRGDSMNDITTITLSKKTRERLGAIGNKNDKNMDDVILRLLDMYEEHRMNQIIEEKSKV